MSTVVKQKCESLEKEEKVTKKRPRESLEKDEKVAKQACLEIHNNKVEVEAAVRKEKPLYIEVDISSDEDEDEDVTGISSVDIHIYTIYILQS